MATTKEAYMLPRDPAETSRLNAQHAFLYQLAHGQLIHSSIPRSEIHSIADVGTGTGIWLKEVAALNTYKNNKTGSAQVGGRAHYVGFDVSAAQFPSDEEKESQGIQFMVHDATKSFPGQYHGTFDLVHVRLLSYAIQAGDLRSVVENVVEILSQSILPLCIPSLAFSRLWAACPLTISKFQSQEAIFNGRNWTPSIAGPCQQRHWRDQPSPTSYGSERLGDSQLRKFVSSSF